jgi:DNA-binding NtrC family response regulator
LSAVILVVDDELNLRLSIAQILREAGHVVTVAEKACEALETLAVLHIDLVFLDLKSRGPAELAFVDEIRGLYPETPLLILNAYPRVDESCPFHDKAEVRFLAKPVDPAAILETVRCMLAGKIKSHS